MSDTAVSPNLREGKAEEVCCYATPCLPGNGDLVVVYRSGSAKHSRDGKLFCVRSTDEGATWSQPSVVFDGLSNEEPEAAHTGYIWRNAEGGIDVIFQTVEATSPDLYIFSEDGRKLLRRCYHASSSDSGRAWTAPRLLHFPETPRDTFLGTKPILMAGGDLFIPLEITAKFGQQAILATFERKAAPQIEPPFVCAEDPSGKIGYGDPRITRFPGGRHIMLL
ncbi:MAG: sialidase family protein [Bryobacteraceae bacterium]